LSSLAHASCAGPMCGVVILFLPIFVVGGAIVGGVAGAIDAVPDERARQIEAQLDAVLAEVGRQDSLRSEVVKAAARTRIPGVKQIAGGVAATTGEGVDYRKLPDLGVDTVLEVGLVRVGLTGRGGDDPRLELRIHAAARLVDARSNAELYRNYALTHLAPPRRYSEWRADNARLLKTEVRRAYESLGRSIVDEVFLIVRSN
ncbi:MAG: hypothetical protein ACREUO_02075, partial [Burkholderiales bacterium]